MLHPQLTTILHYQLTTIRHPQLTIILHLQLSTLNPEARTSAPKFLMFGKR